MEFLASVLQPYSNNRAQPYVTLTFAESSDGKIAGANGQQLLLSGKESMIMTHWQVVQANSKYDFKPLSG